MSDLVKEENNDNPSKISEILADFFLKKIDMPYASDDSDHLHKSKRKKSKHKKRKHKKYKHRHRSSSSNSTAELNIKDVDDISSSEEMGIKRLKKIKSIKLQSAKNLALHPASSASDHFEVKNEKPKNSSNEKPIFYGPSLELLLAGVNRNSDTDSKTNPFPLKDLNSDDKILPENDTKTDLKETSDSFQENFTAGCIQNPVDVRSPNVSVEYHDCKPSIKDSCDNDHEENGMHTAITILNDCNATKKDDTESAVEESNCQPISKDEDPKTVDLKDFKIAERKHDPKVNDELEIDVKNEECKYSMNENSSNISAEEKHCKNEEKVTDTTKETNVDSISTKLDHSDSMSRVSEADKKESKDCMDSNPVSNEKSKTDCNHKKDKNTPVVKSKKKDSKRDHSKSHSRSISPTNRTSSKSKHKNYRTRSSSHDSYAKAKKRRRSRSRSHSHGKTRSRDYRGRSYSRSYSRSRSRSKHKRSKRKSYSRSPHKKSGHRRSRSRSHNRSKESSRRTRRRSKSKEHLHSSSSYHDRSRSRKRKSHSKSKSRSKSRHKSVSPKKSRSRSKSKEKKGSSEKNNKIDQAKILETARRNVLQMIKKGTLPEGLPIENLKKEQLLSIQAGGKSVQELTDFCQRLSQKENEPDASDNEDKEDKADDETGFIHHPFKVKEPGVIKLNIKNAVQLPIKTHAQKVAETQRLSSQFPVSSGNKHKQKELEWVPVVPEASKVETKPTASTVSTVAESSTAIVPLSRESSVSSIPLPTPTPVPVVYPCPPPVEVLPVATATPSVLPSNVPLPPIPPPPPLPPILQSSTVYPAHPSIATSYTVPNQQVMFTTVSAPATPSSSVFKPPKKLDISSIVTKRFQALQKLNENPNDIDALRVLQEAQNSIQEWVESQQVPGLFTGSTDVKLLTVNELSGPFKYRNRKKIEFFSLLEIE